MSTAKKISTSSARERIVDVATDLFYRQGYRATGINEVIEKSGVAKATFYNHFPSKDELYEASLKLLSDNELRYVDEGINASREPRERFLSILRWLKPWATETNFRGCAFLHAATEVPNADSKIRKVGTRLYDSIRSRVEHLAEELVASNRESYGHLDANKLANDYMVAFAGAVSQAEIYHAIWPIEQAIETIERLIGD
jgi:AcrR family transcriptional regulator